MSVAYLIRALRLPFVAASVIPFTFGSLIARDRFNFIGFALGLCCVAATHLSANLINDYADSRSGADWKDLRFFPFFGGSKLIQEGVYSERSYLRLAITFAGLAVLCVIMLSLNVRSIFPAVIYILIMVLSWQYTARPLAFSYRGLGEIFLFLLFGPAAVMGGYYIQTGIFPDMKSFILSLPFGFFTTAILFANEVADIPGDRAAKKFTWAVLLGSNRAFILYYLLALMAFGAISLGLHRGYLGPAAAFSCMLTFPVVRAAGIIRENSSEKEKLLVSSSLTIKTQALAGLMLIAGLFI